MAEKTRFWLAFSILLVTATLLASQPTYAQAPQCSDQSGVFNPVTSLDWSAFFPLKLGEITLMPGAHADPVGTSNPICCCAWGTGIYRFGFYGLRWKFWMPIGQIDITRVPFCFPSLGGMKIQTANLAGVSYGGPGDQQPTGSHSNYQAHYLNYPAFQALKLLTRFECPTSHNDFPGSEAITIEYMSEIDPTWNIDTLALLIQNPEALLFNNPIAQATCAIDCGIQSFSPVNNATDPFIWCAGCQGSYYPFIGTNFSHHKSQVVEAKLRAAQLAFKLHRILLLFTPIGDQLPCPFTMPTGVIRKSHNILQMTYPAVRTAETIGNIQILKEPLTLRPLTGEDFSFILWRKIDCCMPIFPCWTEATCLPFPVCFM